MSEATLASLRARAIHLLSNVSWLPPLFARLVLGVVFVNSGWGKVHDLGKVTQFFTTLRIPAPAFNAALVGWSELICGGLLLVGLLSRLAAVPLIVSMVVAIATAKKGDVHSLATLFGLVELTFVALLLWLVIEGPGVFSVDHGIATWMQRRRARSSPLPQRAPFGGWRDRHA
jgi:putative oxidoreductase